MLAASALIVGAWGCFLWQGVKDPLGGINSLWPLFGIANQLLATVALCVATTIIVKSRKAPYALVTLVPLSWLVSVTFTAAYQKVFSAVPRIGLLAHARYLEEGPHVPDTARLIFNDRMDAAIAGVLVLLVGLVVLEGALEWWRVLSRRKDARTHEVPFVATRWTAEEAP